MSQRLTLTLTPHPQARVSLARAAYSQSDVILLDDPLSAVDAHVGKDILEQCLLQGPLVDKTRILVTHALHVLQHTDYVYVMENGVLTEEGTYQARRRAPPQPDELTAASLQDLIKNGQAFARLVDEFGSQDRPRVQAGALGAREDAADPKAKLESGGDPVELMQKEERNVGKVETVVYAKYLKAAGGLAWAPILLSLLALGQAATGACAVVWFSFSLLMCWLPVGNNLFLGFWTSGSIPGFTQGKYMGVYAALGGAEAVASFAGSFAFRWVFHDLDVCR